MLLFLETAILTGSDWALLDPSILRDAHGLGLKRISALFQIDLVPASTVSVSTVFDQSDRYGIVVEEAICAG